MIRTAAYAPAVTGAVMDASTPGSAAETATVA